jgi:hypothetical protein
MRHLRRYRKVSASVRLHAVRRRVVAVAARDGAELALKNLATGGIRRIQVSDLLADDSYLPETRGPYPMIVPSGSPRTLVFGANLPAP